MNDTCELCGQSDAHGHDPAEWEAHYEDINGLSDNYLCPMCSRSEFDPECKDIYCPTHGWTTEDPDKSGSTQGGMGGNGTVWWSTLRCGCTDGADTSYLEA